MIDNRNVIDAYKGWSEADIISELDRHGLALEIAIENTLRDFNMGTVVRSANAFGVRHVHIIGRKQWNRRGAMATDKYLHLHYYPSISNFISAMKEKGYSIIALDNIPAAQPITSFRFPLKTALVLGQEGPGLSKEMLSMTAQTVNIPQLGSTRSINVGVAAGIGMYEYMRQHTII